MKKLVFSLIAIGMMTVASASNGEVVKKIIIPAKTEIVVKEKIEEVKTVTCTIYVNGHWVNHTYSCFFCWCGAMNGCISEAAKDNDIVL